jgi:hypothetical protein
MSGPVDESFTTTEGRIRNGFLGATDEGKPKTMKTNVMISITGG